MSPTASFLVGVGGWGLTPLRYVGTLLDSRTMPLTNFKLQGGFSSSVTQPASATGLKGPDVSTGVPYDYSAPEPILRPTRVCNSMEAGN